MFLQEFEQAQTHLGRGKKARKEYSAGFRNFHPQKQASQSSLKTQAESDLFDQLKIGNLKELYMQEQPLIDHSKEVMQKQQQSISRLVALPKKPAPEQNQQSEDGKENTDKKFLETYHKVPCFEETANSKLFHSQYNKIDHKLREIFTASKRPGSLEDSISRFILIKHQRINTPAANHDRLVLQYTNFINERFKDAEVEKRTIGFSDFEKVREANFYFYVKFKLPQAEQTIAFAALSALARNQKEINQFKGDDFINKMLNKKFTVPYEPEFNKQPSKQSSIIDQIAREPAVQPKQEKVVFHATPVPPSTYKPPKERPKSAVKAKTAAEPFNLTITNNQKVKKMDDYYNWDRTFHARSIPKTTYQPQAFTAGDEAEKKRRAIQLLQSACFPSTMNYLENYNEYVGEKQENLKKKYTKNHKLESQSHGIPNFQQMHYNQMLLLQARKAENRHQTVPQPFNFKEVKPRKPKESNQVIIEYHQQQRKEGKPKQFIKLQPQSTLKYEAYVDHLRKTKQKKQQTQQQAKKRQTTQSTKKQQYKQILKERIGYQLHNLPKPHISPQDLQSNTVKVNLQKIYNEQPLLIERQSQKNKKPAPPAPKKNWQPII